MLYLDKSKVIELSESLLSATGVQGTHKVHQVVREMVGQQWKLKFYHNSSMTPADNTVEVVKYDISAPTCSQSTSSTPVDHVNEDHSTPVKLQVGQLFAIYYSMFDHWFIGLLVEIGEGDLQHKVRCEFLEQTSPIQNTFRVKGEESWADKKDVFYKLSQAPSPVSISRLNILKLVKEDFDNVLCLFNELFSR